MERFTPSSKVKKEALFKYIAPPFSAVLYLKDNALLVSKVMLVYIEYIAPPFVSAVLCENSVSPLNVSSVPTDE